MRVPTWYVHGQGMATVVYSDADGIERSFTVGAEPVLVGRAPECVVRTEDPRVSRTHARFYLDQFGALYIEDLGSANGVYVGPHKVQYGEVPTGEIVVVGGLLFRVVPANGASLPPVGLHGTLAQWFETERKTRISAEEERDAYGARMAELHQDLRAMAEAQSRLQQEESALRQELEQLRRSSSAGLAAARSELAKAKEADAQTAKAEIARSNAELAAAKEQVKQLEAQLGARSAPLAAAEARAAARASDLEAYRERLAAVDERAKVAEVKLKSTEEELAVARADLLAAEDRMLSETSTAEAALASRIEELAVAHSDLAKAEDRILDLSRTVSELEERLRRMGVF